MFTVTLSAAPNPDYSPNSYNGSVHIVEQAVQVDDLRAASNACTNFIKVNDLGAGNWTGGNIVDETGKIVGYVSYNGRVWQSSKFPSPEIVI